MTRKFLKVKVKVKVKVVKVVKVEKMKKSKKSKKKDTAVKDPPVSTLSLVNHVIIATKSCSWQIRSTTTPGVTGTAAMPTATSVSFSPPPQLPPPL